MNLSTLGISIAFGSCLSIIWTIPFIFLILFGIKLYKITNKRHIPMILTRIGKNFFYMEDDYKKRKNNFSIIYGNPGSGKSMISVKEV